MQPVPDRVLSQICYFAHSFYRFITELDYLNLQKNQKRPLKKILGEKTNENVEDVISKLFF